MSQDIHSLTPKQIMDYLFKKYPNCFIAEGEAKPLKVGIFQDLIQDVGNDHFSKTQLRQALRMYTSNLRYLYGCREGAERVDLEGNSVGTLEKEHVDHAQQRIKQIKEKLALNKAEKVNKKVSSIKKSNSKNKNVKQKDIGKNFKNKEITHSQVDISELLEGQAIKVKVAGSTSSATVLEKMKDSVKVQLKSGMTLTVPIENIYR